MCPRETIEEPYVSPYLRRPLRSIEEVLEARGFSGAVAAAPTRQHASAEADRPESGQVPGLPHHQALGSTEE